jgi:hypothetical protein
MMVWPTQGAGGSSAGPSTVNINMPISQIEDPHAYAQALKWEVSTAF